MLARHVYGLDLADLPLDRVSDKKSRRKRGSSALNSAYNMCSLSQSRVNQQRGSMTGILFYSCIFVHLFLIGYYQLDKL